MVNLKTDSPVSRRIVNAFLDFLQSVEPAPGVDLEGLEVVKECLQEVFKLNPSSTDDATQPGMLVEYFSSLDAIRQRGSCPSHATASVDRPSTSISQDYAEASPSQLPKPKDEHLVGEEPHTLGVSKDELFGQLFGGLDKVQFFNRTIDGVEDNTQIDRATSLFHEAVQELERSGCQIIDSRNLAETFKSQGNKAMQSKLYSDAIELYTYAIALCEKNAVYFCNRAAAYTQVEKFVEAITDCQKSISIDPNYSKAYSRLGLAYCAQGNYFDAIHKGFNKALQLDPHSESIKENIRVVLQKLNSQGRAGLHQNEGSTSHNNNQEQNGQPAGGSGSRGMPSFTAMPFNPAAFSTDFVNMFTNMPSNGNRERSVPPSFTSMSFDSAALPTDFTNMFMNMSGNANHDQHPQEGSHDGTNRGLSEDPEIREGGGNINLNFGENMPEELMGTWRSVMGMFSGAQPHQNSQGDNHRGPTPN